LLSAKRIRESLSVFASLVAVVAIVSGLGVGLLGFLDSAATSGVRADLGMRAGAELALRISQLESADPAAQDRDVRAVITSELQNSGRPIAVEIDRTLASHGPINYAGIGASSKLDGRVTVASVPALSERASLVDGAWPTRDGEATIQADAAALLGLAVGDRIRLGEADLLITGSWRVVDDLDPRWVGDSLPITGVEAANFGPLAVDDATWPLIGEAPEASWTVVPNATAITASDLEVIAAVWPTLSESMDAAGVGSTLFSQDGGFSITADALSARVHALDAVKPIALLMIAAIALVTLLELGRLLAEIREFELALLWSRGATAGELARTTAAETVIVSIVGAAFGAGLAAGVLTLLDGTDALAAIGSALWSIPLAVVAVAAITIAAQTFRATRRSAQHDAPERSGRVQRIAGLGAVVLLSLAAVVSVGQLRLYGSPVTPLAGGGTAVDPVTVVAPALALVSLVLIGLLAFPRIAPLAERTANRRLGADRILAARSVARRLTLVATPIVLVALACGQLVIAGGYAATWESAFTRTQELRAGASVTVTSATGLPETQFDVIAGTDGVTAVAPVYSGELKTAGDYASVIGVAPRAFADLAATADGSLDPTALAASVDIGLSLPAVSAAEGDLIVTISTTGFVAPPGVSVWLGDEFGQLRQIELRHAAGAPPTLRYSAPVPALLGSGNAWHLTAVDIAASSSSGPSPRADVVAIERDGEAVELGGPWTGYGFGDTFGPLGAATSDHGTSFPAGTAVARLLPGTEDPLADPIPVVISSTLAERIDAVPGTVLSLPLVARTAPVLTVITDVVVGIPGASDAAAVLVDSAVVSTLQLRSLAEPPPASVHWVGTADPRPMGDRLRQGLPGEVDVEVIELDPDREMLGSAVISLWVAAVGSALLALAALGAVAGAQLRGRRGEVVVLRAIGMGSRQQGRIRRREFDLVTAFGAVVGVLAGLLAALATIAPLARSAVPDSYPEVPTATMFEPISLALALAGLLLLVIATIAVYGANVTAQARVLGGQEVVR
jgi:hypothetical protein